jgi:dCMP deaminase
MDTLKNTGLSEEAIALLTYWKVDGKHVDVERPNWDLYYLDMAFEVSQRSLDAQTKHGCIITNPKHQPLGFGYNSFVRDIDDSVLPNVRPDKYPFMIHSELNAIFNCTSPPTDGIAYITGPPCPHCLQCLWQAGIKEIVHAQLHSHMQQETQVIEEVLIYLLRNQGLIYRGVDYVRNQTN